MRIIIDGFFYQIARSGIARVWSEMVTQWAMNSPDIDFYFLDREQNDISIDGVQTVKFTKAPIEESFNSWTLEAMDDDRDRLNKMCTELEADVFLSTYYTYVDNTPNIMLVHDMIPENNPGVINLDEPIWRMKSRTTYAASGYICVSYNTARELYRHYDIDGRNVLVCHNGVDAKRTSLDREEKVPRADLSDIPFILVPGLADPTSYKNQLIIFKALRSLLVARKIRIIVTGKAAPNIIKRYQPYCFSEMVEARFMTEGELDWHYRNAIAVVYPSKEEGFGLPVIEALARGAIPVTTKLSSIPEVGEHYAIYTNPDNELELLESIRFLLKIRELAPDLFELKRLSARADLFQWDHMARRIDVFTRQVVLERQHSDWMSKKGF